RRVGAVFVQLQRGVVRAGGGAVDSEGALLERADHLVAVAGLLLQQLQDDVLEVALLEAPVPRAPQALDCAARVGPEPRPALSEHICPPVEYYRDISR